MRPPTMLPKPPSAASFQSSMTAFILPNASSPVIGIGDRFSGHDDAFLSLAAARSIGGVPIVLTHSPDVVPDLPANLPLVLAGHTHCGQVVLPWIGPLVMRAAKD